MRYLVRIFNTLANVTPEVLLGIPAAGKKGRQLHPVAWKDGVMVVVNSFKNWVIIKLSPEVDMRQCSLRVGSRVDVDITTRIKKREWKIKFPYRASGHSISPAELTVIIAPDEENETPTPPPPPPESSGTN